MTRFKQFAILLRKEARALAGPFFAILAVLAVLAAAGLVYMTVIPEPAAGPVPEAPPLLAEFYVMTIGLWFVITFAAPVATVLYTFWIERQRGTFSQLRALPVNPRAWGAAKLAIVGAAVLALQLMAGIDYYLGEWLMHKWISVATFRQVFPVFSGDADFFFICHLALLGLVFGAAAFLAWTAASGRRFTAAIWTAAFIVYFIGFIWLDTLLKPAGAGYVKDGGVYTAVTAPGYMLLYPAAWIVLSVVAGLYVHGRWGET